MGLTCYCECNEENAAWWYSHSAPAVLQTLRPRRCKSCNELLHPACEGLAGVTVLPFARWRGPHNEVEERIHGDEVPLAPWYLCSGCYPIYLALDQAGVCVQLGENMEELLNEFNTTYAPKGFRLKLSPGWQFVRGEYVGLS